MPIQIQRLLLPTDFSTYSAAATKYACELAAKFDAELHLLHALETHLASAPVFSMGLALPIYINESRNAAEKAMTRVLDPQWSAGRTILHAVVDGSPKVEIVSYARKYDIDLIVLATHGRSGLSHAIIGSVAESAQDDHDNHDGSGAVVAGQKGDHGQQKQEHDQWVQEGFPQQPEPAIARCRDNGGETCRFEVLGCGT